MISIVNLDFGPPPHPMCFPTALLPGKKCSANWRLTIATFASFFTSITVKSRPSRNGIFIVSKYPGDSAFMNACWSSPSAYWCPSTAMELPHSLPARIGTVASAADFTPGADRMRSSTPR